MTGGAPIRFEDRLLAELMPLVGVVEPVGGSWAGRQALLQQRPVHPPAVSRRRIAALLGLLVLVLAAAGLGAAVWPRQLATAAYAVQEQSDGSLLVTVNDMRDPRGLQDTLAAHRVPATVLVIDPAAPCTAPLASVPAPGALAGRPDHPNVLAIRPDLLPPGTTAVIGLRGDQDGATTGAVGAAQAGQPTVLFAVVRGPAPRCFPGAVPDPVPVPTAS